MLRACNGHLAAASNHSVLPLGKGVMHAAAGAGGTFDSKPCSSCSGSDTGHQPGGIAALHWLTHTHAPADAPPVLLLRLLLLQLLLVSGTGCRLMRSSAEQVVGFL
jgi:hypothetical protein